MLIFSQKYSLGMGLRHLGLAWNLKTVWSCFLVVLKYFYKKSMNKIPTKYIGMLIRVIFLSSVVFIRINAASLTK